MIGNDVVDLGDPDSRPGATHPRFDARVFADCERRALESSGAPNRLRWTLWAAKEAAYKVARNLDRRCIFAPSRFVVRLGASGSGQVHHGAHSLSVQVEVDADRVHAIAASGLVEPVSVHSGVIPVPGRGGASPGAAVREEVLRRVAELIGSEASELSIAKEGRIPFIRRGAERLALDLSLSHHGRYAAWACGIPPLRRATR